jgi:hypothetical protein
VSLSLPDRDGTEAMGDPFLNYFALFLLVFVVVVLFYGIIAIHDIPYMIAESRHHPHQDAIYAAGWVSLFTLHAIWPFLWIWAMAYRPDRGWGFSSASGGGPPPDPATELAELKRRIAALEDAQVRNVSSESIVAEAAAQPRPAGKRKGAGKPVAGKEPAPGKEAGSGQDGIPGERTGGQ